MEIPDHFPPRTVFAQIGLDLTTTSPGGTQQPSSEKNHESTKRETQVFKFKSKKFQIKAYFGEGTSGGTMSGVGQLESGRPYRKRKETRRFYKLNRDNPRVSYLNDMHNNVWNHQFSNLDLGLSDLKPRIEVRNGRHSEHGVIEVDILPSFIIMNRRCSKTLQISQISSKRLSTLPLSYYLRSLII